MELPPLDEIPDHIPIPALFQSIQHEGPFEECVACGRPLLIDGVQYLIEKAIREGETIFEYAICFGCHEGLQDDLSEESLRRVDAHFSERVDLVERRESLLAWAAEDADPWIEACILSKKPRQRCNEYQLFAQCDGGDLLFTYLPYMICGEAMEELIRLLSKKTRETLDDFTGRHLGMPPEFESSPTDPRLLIF